MSKKILITGLNSYIGNSFADWISQFAKDYQADKISVRTDEWKEADFSSYDTILNVAGIAHVDAKAEMEELYYKVNRDLAIALAKKAKAEGVRQYIYMSSIIVYGGQNPMRSEGIITKHTIPSPDNFYGRSKLEAEEGILKLQSDAFHPAVIRSPMIYGRNSKGNYRKLVTLADKCPIFPEIQNQRSMLYIDNLCELLRLLVEHGEQGIFYPQNKEYVCTSDLVKKAAACHGKKLTTTSILNPLLRVLGGRMKLIHKVFGNLCYDKEMSQISGYDYQITDWEKSVELSEGR